MSEKRNPNISIFSPENHLQKGFSFGHVVGEDAEWVLNHLHVALPKGQMGLVFWVLLLEIVSWEKK